MFGYGTWNIDFSLDHMNQDLLYGIYYPTGS